MHAVGKLVFGFVRNSLLNGILLGKVSAIRQSFISRHKNVLKWGNRKYDGLIAFCTSRDTGSRGLATARASCHGIWSRDVPRDVTHVEVHSP
jgi:hypothetical protein